LHFLKLRNHSHAQYEIRVYAEVIQKILAVWVPHIANAADDYIFNSIQLSALETNVIGCVLTSLLTTKEFAEEIPDGVLSKMTRREKQEFFAKISEMMKPQVRV